MKLEIASCREVEPSQRADAIRNFISEGRSDSEVARYLQSNFEEDFFEVEDLRCWGPVLERLDSILNNEKPYISTCDHLSHQSDDGHDSKFIVRSVLSFLILLLKSAADKRYFFGIEPVRTLFRSTDLDIAVLAAEVLFNLCVPANSLINSLNEDYNESLELPTNLTNDALASFDALSLMSTDFGITEYLHGHQPSFIHMKRNEHTKEIENYLNIQLPPRQTGKPVINIELTSWKINENETEIHEKLMKLQKEYNLNSNEIWIIYNIQNTLKGLQSSDINMRLKIIRLRLYSFFMLIHSKVESSLIQDYIRSTSRFLLDLVELSDLSSEASSELNLSKPVLLSYLALENVLGLLENKLRRRSSFIVQSNILPMLGLQTNLYGSSTSSSGRSEGAWTAIIMSACAMAPTLFNAYSDCGSSTSTSATTTCSHTLPNTTTTSRTNTNGTTALNPLEIAANGKFIRIALELFVLSLTTREQSNVVTDLPLIGTIIGVVMSALPHVERILLCRRGYNNETYISSTYDTHVLLVTSKALYCIELLLERPEYLTAFRESEGLTAISRVLEIFGTACGSPGEHGQLDFCDQPARNVLEGGLCSLYLCIQKSRHTVMLQGNTTDTGVRVVYQTYFSDLCCKLFRSPYHTNETLWGQLITVIKEAIDLDPSYLAHFLSSSYATILRNTILIPYDASFPQVYFAPKYSTDLDNLLIPLARLTNAISITAEGRAYIIQTRIFHFILEALIQPCCLLPGGHELDSIRLGKLGKLFGQIMVEYEDLRLPLKEMLRKRLILHSKETADCVPHMTNELLSTDLQSPRIQALQKLTYICTIVENCFTERRVRHDDVVRDILNPSAIEALLAAYPATLPTPRQLFAQLSMRHINTSPHYGHSASAKAVSALLKVASSQATHSSMLITLLSKEIDKSLSKLGMYLTRNADIQKTSGGSISAESEKSCGFSSPSPPTLPSTASSTTASNNRGAKFTPPQSVLLLGVLDNFPHQCVMDPTFPTTMEDNGFTFDFLSTLLLLEWQAILLGQAVRTDQRIPQSRSVVTYKDTFRRLFAFHKSSLLEVCRFSATKWTSKELPESRFKKTLPECLCRLDSSEDTEFIPRLPSSYLLRIAGSGGALVREGIEIEGSRVVLTADVGSVLYATERRINEGGVMRYRTAHGWISEFRRDHQRSPIVELMDIPMLSDEDVAAEKNKRVELQKGTDETKLEQHCATEALTLREGACICLIKTNAALRQVASFLSRAMYGAEANAFGRSASQHTPSPVAPLISMSLSKMVEGFLSHPQKCIPDSALPVLSGLRSKVPSLSDLDTAVAGSGKGKGPDTSPTLLTSMSSKPLLGGSTGKYKRGKMDEDSNHSDVETGEIDLTTLCLYYGCCVKQFLLPVLEDKNGNINILLLRTLCNQHVSELFCQAFSTLVLILKQEIANIPAMGVDGIVPQISKTGRAALSGLPVMLSVVQRLCSQELLSKSIAGANLGGGGGVPSVPLVDEVGPYQAHELLFQVFSALHRSIEPLLEDKATRSFPSDLQHDWYTVVCELLQSLSAGLPVPAGPRRAQPGYNPSTMSASRVQGGIADSAAVGRLGRMTPSRSPAPNPQVVSILVEMGFVREQVISAMNTLRTSNTDMIVQYMFSHPWTPPVAADATSDPVPTEGGTAAVSTTATPGALSESTTTDQTAGQASQNATVTGTAPSDDPVVTAAATPQTPPASLVPSGASILPVGATSPLGLLPNLVNDLDEATGGGTPPVQETPIIAPTDEEPPERETEEQLSLALRPPSTTAALDRFRQDMDMLFTNDTSHSREPNTTVSTPLHPSRLSWTRADDGTISPSTFSNGSRGRSERDEASAPALAGRDHASHSQRLATWASEMSAQVVPNILATCMSYEQVCQWDARETHMLMPFMVDLLLRLKQGSSPAKELSFTAIYEQIIALLKDHAQEVGSGDNPAVCSSLHGLMYLLHQIIVQPVIRKGLVSAGALSRDCVCELVDLVLTSTKNVIQDRVQHWPRWISPAMLILFELLSLPAQPSSTESTAAADTIVTPSKNASVLSTPSIITAGCEEKEEKEGELCETKTDETVSKPEAVQNSSAALLNQVQLLPDTIRRDVFNLVISMMDTCLATNPMDAESMQGVLIVLHSLVNNQSLVDIFVNEGGLSKILQLTSKESSPEHQLSQFRVLTLIVRRCMETCIELEQVYAEHIRSLVSSKRGEDKCMPFNTFLSALAQDILHSPEVFWRACRNTVKIIKVLSDTRKNNPSVFTSKVKSEIKVRLLEEEEHLRDLLLRVKDGEPDHRGYIALKALFQHIVALSSDRELILLTTEEAKVSHILSISSALNAAADAILSLKRAPMLAAKLIRSESEHMQLEAGTNFVDFLISKFRAESLKVATEGTSSMLSEINPEISAASRMLVALCAFKGPSRIITLDSILKNFRMYCTHTATCATTILVDSKSDESEQDCGRQAEIKRVLMISRFANLFSIIVRASKTPGKDGSSPKGQGVSIDTLHYLMERGHILQLLTQALASIPVQLQVAATAVTSLLDLMDMITQPKIRAYLEKFSVATAAAHKKALTSKSHGSSAHTSEMDVYAHTSSTEHGADDIFVMGAEDSAAFSSASQRSASPGDGLFIGQPRFQHAAAGQLPEHEEASESSDSSSDSSEEDDDEEDSDAESDEDDDGDDEEDEDDGSSSDEDDDEHDGDDEEHEHEEEGLVHQHGMHRHDDEEDEDEAEQQLRQLMDEASFFNQDADDAYVNVDNSAASRSAAEQLRLIDRLDRAFLVHGDDPMEVRDLDLDNAAFITPPNRNNQEFQMVLNVDPNSEDPIGDFTEMVRRLGQGLQGGGPPSYSDRMTVMSGTGSETPGRSLSELLPQGVAAALEVAPSHIQHPMLRRDSAGMIGNHPRAPSRVPGMGNVGAMFAQMHPPPFIRRNAINAGSMIHRAPRGSYPGPPGGLLQMSYNTNVDISGGLLDMHMYDEFDPAAPAVWPRGGPTDNIVRRGRTGSGAPPFGAADGALGGLDVTELVLRQIEANMIEGLEIIEESAADEASQGSFTETSRGGDGAQTEGGYSYSEQSNIALQDPNPRRRGGDSRTGDPIPPIIEIENRDHEGNEELSVITLPQDDPNQTADHEDSYSVNSTHELSRVRRGTPSMEIAAAGRALSPAARTAAQVPLFSATSSQPVPVSNTESVTSSGPEAAPATSQANVAVTPSTASAEEAIIASESYAAEVTAETVLPPPPPAPAAARATTDAAISGIAFDSLLLSFSSPSAGSLPPPPALLQSGETEDRDQTAEQPSAITDTSPDTVVNAEDTSTPMVVEETAAISATSTEESAAESSSSSRLACPPGYDEEVFYSLPEDMQQEIIDQHGGESADPTRELIEAAGLDYDAISALPESIRQEVLEQARRDQQAASGDSGAGGSGEGGSHGQDMDNASFLVSLTPDLRAEVLLTADAEFLATLPPELVAEAQTVRERAASSWQRRELMSRMGARDNSGGAGASATSAGGSSGPQLVSSSGIGAPGEFYGDDDDEEDEDDDDDLDLHAMIPSGRHAAAYHGERSVRTKPDRPKTGLMKVPGSQTFAVAVPSSLALAVVRVILNAPKSPSRSSLAYRILQNVCSDLITKDVNMKLLISLVGGNQGMLADCLHQLTGGDGDLKLLSDCDPHLLNSESVKKPSLSSPRKHSFNEEITVSSIAAQRILMVLSNMVSNNSAFVYLLLTERNAQLSIVDQDTATKLQEGLHVTAGEKGSPESVPATADGASDDRKESSEDSRSYSIPIASPRHAAVIPESTNSLLEMIICLFSRPNLSSSATELDSLTNLLSIVTSPLDQLRDNGTTAVAPPPSMDTAGGLSRHHVPVPRVVLTKESLGYLCDVLLNDLCSKRVLMNITSVISRLSKIQPNHALLLELIADVIVDLAEQSQMKLVSLSGTLKQIHQKYTVTQREKDAELERRNKTEAASKLASLKGGAVEAPPSPLRANRASQSNSAAVKKSLPASLLPLGEAGGKQHDRLLRVVQTLHSMAQKTGRQLSEVTPTEELIELWRGLDDTLAQLRKYLADEEDDEAHSQESTTSTRPQSALTSIVNRLLPALEAFFLVHASDFLAEKPRAAVSGEKSGADGAAAESSASTDAKPAATTTPVAPISSELIPQSSMPGHSYRTSAAYQRNNISLFSSEASTTAAGAPLEDGSPLLSTRSLRKQASLSSMNSRTFSILTSKAQRLLQFVQSHKGLLNLVIKARPALLEDSFSSFIRIKELRACLKFDNKRKYFFSQLKKSNQSVSRRGIHLQIRRSQVFEDSFHQLRGRTAEELRGRLQVNFYGEEGVDAGGLTREWYVILAREIFNPNYALFTAAVDGATFQPNPLSVINMNHLDYFKFVGRLIGKAICDGQLLDAHFTRSFYKHLLGMPVDFLDIEATEPDYYKTLRQVLETPLDLLMMDLTFSAEVQQFGRTEVVDLIPNGRNVAVTDENKSDYIRLVAHHRMTSGIRKQIDSFLSGFYDLVPAELVSIFSPTELELLICGLPDVSIDELQQHTDYHQYKATDESIVWFWEALRSFNREERASFLQFVTGTSKVPLGGFANLQGMRGTQRFSVHRAYGDNERLPSAHTCFNQLDLPVYSSAEVLREKLLTAITEGVEGFGFA